MKYTAVTVLSVAFIVAGCELFITREPEPPVGGAGDGWQFPQTPRIVLSNLASAIGRRSVVDYLHCFSEGDTANSTFRFQPDPLAAAEQPGFFDNWGLKQEQGHIQALFNPINLPLDSLAVLEYAIDRETLLNDSAALTASYDLHIGHIRAETPREMTGRLEFRLRRSESGGWFVHNWQDNRLDEQPCWSDLKAKI